MKKLRFETADAINAEAPEIFAAGEWRGIIKPITDRFNAAVTAYENRLSDITAKEKAAGKKKEAEAPAAGKFKTLADVKAANKANTITAADFPALKALQQQLVAAGKTVEAGEVGTIIEENE